MRPHKFSAVVVSGFLLAAASLLGASAGWAEQRPLHLDDSTCMDPDSVLGSTEIVDQPVGKVAVKIKVDDAAAAGLTFQVFWVCTTIQNGCHVNSCGFVSIGELTVNAQGKGVFNQLLTDGNPFPGQFVHVDICPGNAFGCTGGPLYTSTFESRFQGGTAANSRLSGSPADPTQ